MADYTLSRHDRDALSAAMKTKVKVCAVQEAVRRGLG